MEPVGKREDQVAVCQARAVCNFGLRLLGRTFTRRIARRREVFPLRVRMFKLGDRGRGYHMEKRGDGVPIILHESESVSGRRPEYRLIDDSELLLTIFSALPAV